MGAHPYGAVIHLKQWEGLCVMGFPLNLKVLLPPLRKIGDLLDKFPKSKIIFVSKPKDVEDWSSGLITFEDGTNAVVIASDVTLGRD